MDQAEDDRQTADSVDRLALLEGRLAALEQARGGGMGTIAQRVLRYLPFIAIGNLLVGVPAVAISLGVAYFAFVQAEATEKMQVASVWPRVTYVTSNIEDDGRRRITLSLVNKGVGPALIRGLQIRYRDKAYVSFRQLLSDCCARDVDGASIGVSTINGEVLRPGEAMMFALLEPDGTPTEVYRKFNAARAILDVDICYCSVFQECWVDKSDQAEPSPVDFCPADWVQYTGFPQGETIRP